VANNLLTPAANFFGNLTVKAEISDGELYDTTTFTVSVTPVDDITTAVRDSLSSVSVRHTLIDSSLVGDVVGHEDTVVTTTVVDSITDTHWSIIGTFTEGVLTSSAPAVIDSVVVREVVVSTTPVTIPYVAPVITTTVRDSLVSSAPVRHILVDSSLVGTMVGQEDTLVTTTIVDSIVDSTWQITDTFTDDVLTSTAPEVFGSTVNREVIVRTEPVTLPYQSGDVAIEKLPSVRNSSNEQFLFAPNPVSSTDREIYFVTPSNLHGDWIVSIYDNSGNLIDQQKFYSDGGYTYRWDLRNSNGQQVGSGTYVAFITVETADGSRKLFKQMIGVQR